ARRQRSTTLAAPSLGNSRDQARGHGISTSPIDLSLLSNEYLRRASCGRAAQPSRIATGGPDGLAHGLLPAEQAAGGPVSGLCSESTLFARLGREAPTAGDGRG